MSYGSMGVGRTRFSYIDMNGYLIVFTFALRINQWGWSQMLKDDRSCICVLVMGLLNEQVSLPCLGR